MRFKELKGSTVLTLGETPRFLVGGMVMFSVEDDSVQFDVNLEAAERVGLSISARMPATARKVTTGRH